MFTASHYAIILSVVPSRAFLRNYNSVEKLSHMIPRKGWSYFILFIFLLRILYVLIFSIEYIAINLIICMCSK